MKYEKLVKTMDIGLKQYFLPIFQHLYQIWWDEGVAANEGCKIQTSKNRILYEIWEVGRDCEYGIEVILSSNLSTFISDSERWRGDYQWRL